MLKETEIGGSSSSSSSGKELWICCNTFDVFV